MEEIRSEVLIESAAIFGSVREQFEAMERVAASEEASRWTHDQMEAWVSTEGREFQRRFLQAMFDLRAEREKIYEVVVGADGIERTHRRVRSRPLATVVGNVEAKRMTYSAPEEGSRVPLDSELGLPTTMYSHGLQKEAARESVRGSFENAQESVERHTGVKIPKRQILDLVRDAAVDFEAFYKSQYLKPVQRIGPDLLILSVDGKGVVMRREGLRDGTREAAEAAEPKLERRTSKGEKRNRKRMATVAAVYTIKPFVRAPEAVMDPPEDQVRPRAANKRVWARLDVSMQQVVRDLFDEAESRDPEHQQRWVVLVDGLPQQLKLVRREAKRRKVEITIVLDFIHVLEYLWKAAWNFFEHGDANAEEWVNQRALEILRGRAPHVAAGIRRSATKRHLDDRAGADECANYLLKKKRFLCYGEALAAGLPIASGVIEGTCRHLINDRLDITGARWGLDGAEAVLRLRSLWASGDFNDYWNFHVTRDRERTYGDDYIRMAA